MVLDADALGLGLAEVVLLLVPGVGLDGVVMLLIVLNADALGLGLEEVLVLDANALVLDAALGLALVLVPSVLAW